MGKGVVPKEVPAIIDQFYNLNMVSHIFANAKKGCRYIMFLQDVKNFGRFHCIGSVIKGDGDDFFICISMAYDRVVEIGAGEKCHGE